MSDEQVHTRRRLAAVLTGLAAVVAYAGGAWLSGSESPMARRALLDSGPINVLPYRWVNPPPALADGNEAPTPGDFTIAFAGTKSDAGVFTTEDQQASVVLSRGAVAKASGASSVHLTTTPVDPGTLSAPPDGQSVLGNAYQVSASYQPGDATVGDLVAPSLVVLTYPALITHGAKRTLLFSPDGTAWTALKTTDEPSSFQASASITTLNGYFEVAANGPISVSPSAGPGGGSAGGSAIPWIVIGAAVLVAGGLVIGRIQARRSAQPPAAKPRPPGPGSTPAGGAKPPSGTASATTRPPRSKSRKKRRR